MTQILDRYRRNADAFADTIRAVPPDRWDSPSPCPDWDARGVVAHVVSTLSMFEELVGREQRPGPSVDDDPLGAFEAVRTQVEEELADPALADVEFDGFFGRSSFAKAVDTFLSGDLVTHRWDLAKATGGDLTIPQDEIERAWQDVEGFGDALRSPGAFGPEVEVPDDADEQTKLLAFLGREA
ncbi:TIGR03086 family metal-binding protein [Angustibacter luteus]|uniref:TIGR03086 family metal-binding protein n=1 Tax=Angustibacter luteus TaxID=658456 RepID=A0ABW1JK61_9ACTN